MALGYVTYFVQITVWISNGLGGLDNPATITTKLTFVGGADGVWDL